MHCFYTVSPSVKLILLFFKRAFQTVCASTKCGMALPWLCHLHHWLRGWEGVAREWDAALQSFWRPRVKWGQDTELHFPMSHHRCGAFLELNLSSWAVSSQKGWALIAGPSFHPLVELGTWGSRSRQRLGKARCLVRPAELRSGWPFRNVEKAAD